MVVESQGKKERRVCANCYRVDVEEIDNGDGDE
jgi:hypothetical protein